MPSLLKQFEAKYQNLFGRFHPFTGHEGP